MEIFLQNFLKLQNMIFYLFRKQDHWCQCASNLCPKASSRLGWTTYWFDRETLGAHQGLAKASLH
jgi:hypothetical protein